MNHNRIQFQNYQVGMIEIRYLQCQYTHGSTDDSLSVTVDPSYTEVMTHINFDNANTYVINVWSFLSHSPMRFVDMKLHSISYNNNVSVKLAFLRVVRPRLKKVNFQKLDWLKFGF